MIEDKTNITSLKQKQSTGWSNTIGNVANIMNPEYLIMCLMSVWNYKFNTKPKLTLYLSWTERFAHQDENELPVIPRRGRFKYLS